MKYIGTLKKCISGIKGEHRWHKQDLLRIITESNKTTREH